MVSKGRAPDAAVVHETGVVVEVDNTFEVFLVGDIASEQRCIPAAAAMCKADANAAFHDVAAVELDSVIDQELHVALEHPVRREVQLARGQRDVVLQADVVVPFRRVRQRVAVDDRTIHAVQIHQRIDDRAGARATDRDQQVRIVDLGVVEADRKLQQQVVGQQGVHVEIESEGIGLVRVDELDAVVDATDGRDLLVIDLVVEDGAIHAYAAIVQCRLEADFCRGDRLGQCRRGQAEERDVATLDRRATEAVGDAAVEVRGVAHRVQQADVPAELVVLHVDRSGLTERRGRRAHVLLVVRVAHAGRQVPGVRHVVAELSEDGPGGVLVLADRAGHEERLGQDFVLVVEVEHAGLPEQLVAGFRGHAEFLRQLLEVIDAVARRRLERDEARTRRIAAVDVAEARILSRFVGRDRGQRHRAREIPVELDRATELLGRLRVVVAFVERNDVTIEVRVQVAAARRQDVRAEDLRGALVVAPVQVDERAEIFARLEQQLAADRKILVLAKRIVLPGEAVVDPVVAIQVEDREAARNRVAEAAACCGFEIQRADFADRCARVTVEVFARLDRVELDDAGRRVAAEQRALRAAQHFDALDVEQREALQDHVFHDHFVHDDGHGLRGREVEVRIAEAAQVETRCHAAVRGLGIEARHAAGQRANVFAALEYRGEAVAGHRGDRNRYVFQAFFTALRRDADFFEYPFHLRAGRCAEQAGQGNRGADRGQEQSGFRAALKCWVFTTHWMSPRKACAKYNAVCCLRQFIYSRKARGPENRRL